MSPTSYQAAPPRGNFKNDFALKGLVAVVLLPQHRAFARALNCTAGLGLVLHRLKIRLQR